MAAPPSSSPDETPSPSWVILGAIPRISAADDHLSFDLAAPPRVSLLTIPKRIFPAEVTRSNCPGLVAADPSGLLLLHADQGCATGPTVIDRPNHHSFCWKEFVAGYFVIAAAHADAQCLSALALPEPELIMNAGHVGIIASPTGDGYMVTELHPFLGDDRATLLCFSSDVGEWVDKTVTYPLPSRPLSPDAVLSLHCRLWWVDMYRNRDPAGALQVTVWTLPEPDSTGWELEHQASFHDIWAHHTYGAAGLPTKIPVLALIHPQHPAVVYFFLEDYLFAVDLRDCAVVDCDRYDLVDPPRDLVSTTFVHAWQLPRPLLSPSSPASAGFAREDTESGSNDVGAPASAHI
ncbi:hypothetical protein HU200_064279 [Digitaria exilis]|uniref:DUF1618 domain-containing protein n=1 Tax=Digitaria exilis TaxID=1010633 RepID=A0A835ABZ1_9POAL|nr:hypothetical protein HU200_064279 [Digitaria exilis]